MLANNFFELTIGQNCTLQEKIVRSRLRDEISVNKKHVGFVYHFVVVNFKRESAQSIHHNRQNESSVMHLCVFVAFL